MVSSTRPKTLVAKSCVVGALVATLVLCAAQAEPITEQTRAIVGVKVDGRDGPTFLASLAQFENWFGRPAGAVLSYSGIANWLDYEGSLRTAAGYWSKVDRPVLWSIPLIPAKTQGAEMATLADAGKGLYNSHYKALATRLSTTRPGDAVIYVRTGWEFNGGWYPWTVHNGHGDDFIAAFRQFVTTFRSVSPRFRFDWCPAWGDQVRGSDGKPAPLGDFYPGDEYVDVIGLDVYDETQYTKIADPKKRWQFYLTRGHGLNWHRDFALQHGKPMSFPEWGVGASAGDDPYFVEQFHKWMQGKDVVYHTYWNSDSSYKGKLSAGAYPQAGAKYKELFGSVAPNRPILTVEPGP